MFVACVSTTSWYGVWAHVRAAVHSEARRSRKRLMIEYGYGTVNIAKIPLPFDVRVHFGDKIE
jgi:hypothetical protein